MKIDRRTGMFYGVNPSGHADAAFFNNLGIRSSGYFDGQVLTNFITYPTIIERNLNMSLLGHYIVFQYICYK
jgi:hypothetical protein